MKRKIAFICHFSNEIVRLQLPLKKYFWVNKIRSIFRKKEYKLYDFAPWVTMWISAFEDCPEFDFHIIAPHKGLKKHSKFSLNNINYYFIKFETFYFIDLFLDLFKLRNIGNFKRTRRNIVNYVNSINPDLVVICGAENPYYSLTALDIKNKPKFVLLQTFLNSEKRKDLNIGNDYRRNVEREIIINNKYLTLPEMESFDQIKLLNPTAKIYNIKFPVIEPPIYTTNSEYDFVFYSKELSKSKGVEDTIWAMKSVVEIYPMTSICIIGDVDSNYLSYLKEISSQNNIQHIQFYPSFTSIYDLYREVQKAKYAILPGKTGVLNSTVRECMFMKKAVVLYENNATLEINQNKKCLLTAQLDNVEELSKQMIYLLENPLKALELAANANEYARNEYGLTSVTNELLSIFNEIIDDYKI